MSSVTLSKFVEEHGQTKAGEMLGVTQGAIWQMLKAERKVYVREIFPGQFEAEEVKPIGRKRVQHAAQ